MNNTFDINRFGLLIRKQWLEYGKLYLISLGIISGILISAYGSIYWQITHQQDNNSLNFLLQLNIRWQFVSQLGILFLSLAANHYFSPLSQKPKAILELTLPASSLEKFLVGILFSTILALLSYLIIFYLVDLAFVSKLRAEFPKALSTIDVKGSAPLPNVKVPEYFFIRLHRLSAFKFTPFAGVFCLSTLFLLGSLYFKKFQYIKTAITTLVFCGLWLSYVINLQEFMFVNKIEIENNQFSASRNFVAWGILVFLLLFTTISYVIAYIRFKEKEV